MLNDQHDGYQENAAVDAANRAAIAAYSGEDSLVLHKLAADLYGWVLPYHNTYYDAYYKEFYGLPREVEMIWE